MRGPPDRDRILDTAAIGRASRVLSERLGGMDLRDHVDIVGGAVIVLTHRRTKSIWMSMR